MSNTGIFKSSELAVEQVGAAFRMVGAAASNIAALAKGSTNLTVISNMTNANAELNSCQVQRAHYKIL